MKLSDIKGEQALDVLADILEPASEIIADKEFLAHARGGNKIKAVRVAIKNHKKEIITIMAILNGTTPDKYEFNLVTLPVQVLQLLNDPEMMILFHLQGQIEESVNSGSATDDTQDAKK